MQDTPHSRLALVPISLELLTELLRGQCAGPLETDAPPDLVVCRIEMLGPGVAIAVVASATFDETPIGDPVRRLQKQWTYTRPDPDPVTAERRRFAALAARLFKDDPHAIHPDVALDEMNESARTAAHHTAQIIAQKILASSEKEPTT